MLALRVRELMSRQWGVLSWSRALGSGLDDNDIERLLRRREWARLHPGASVDHTGAPTWDERASAGVAPARMAAGARALSDR